MSTERFYTIGALLSQDDGDLRSVRVLDGGGKATAVRAAQRLRDMDPGVFASATVTLWEVQGTHEVVVGEWDAPEWLRDA